MDIPREIESFLSLGPKFSIHIPKNKFSVQRLLADIEFIVDKNVNDDNKNILRARVTNLVTNYLQDTPNCSNYYQNLFLQSQRFLKEHPSLLVLQSDKGNVTVIMQKTTYVDLANQLLLDDKYYKILNRDPTLTLQNKSNQIIKEFSNKGYITSEEAKKLFEYNTIPALFYGLPKIHKPTLSLRPIVSSINTPTSNLSVFASKVLSASLDNNNRYYVKDSFQAAMVLNNFQLPENYVIISLDIVSLFSNIPTELAVNIIDNKWDKIQPHTKVRKDDFLRLLRFIFSSCYFSFDNKIYNVTWGCPMGSSLSPVIARIVTDHLLDEIIQQLPFNVPLIKKYVDDIVMFVPAHLTDFTLDVFNNHNEHIKFTIEKENNNSVPFLDTKLIRTSENTIILDWYRKPMCSNRFINFQSIHPMRQKINLVLAMKNRIEKICHPTLKNKNFQLLKNIMMENGYPEPLLCKLIFNSRRADGAPRLTTEPRLLNNICTLPNIPFLTSNLIKILKDENVTIVSRNEFTLRKLSSKTKDLIGEDRQRNVVYSIPCSFCDLVYIGQTSQQLKKRLIQHKSDIKQVSKTCALAEHTRRLGHPMIFEDTKILEVETSYIKRSFLEMFHIKRNKNAMNSKTDIQGISNIYSFLIDHKF